MSAIVKKRAHDGEITECFSSDPKFARVEDSRIGNIDQVKELNVEKSPLYIPNQSLKKAINFSLLGEFEKSNATLENLLAQDKDNLDALILQAQNCSELAKQCFQQENMSASQAELETWSDYANHYEQIGHIDLSEYFANLILKRNNQNSEALKLKAINYQQKAAQSLSRIKSINANFIPSKQKSEQSDPFAVASLSSEQSPPPVIAESSKPQESEQHVAQSSIPQSSEQNNSPVAESSRGEVSDNSDDSIESDQFYKYGKSLQLQGAWSLAIEVYDKLINERLVEGQYTNGLHLLLFRRGECLTRLKKFAEALSCYTKGKEICVEKGINFKANNKKGFEKLLDEMYSADNANVHVSSIPESKKAQLLPINPEKLVLRSKTKNTKFNNFVIMGCDIAKLAKNNNAFNGALEYFKKAEKLIDVNRTLYWGLAYCLYNLERYDEALIYCNKYLENYPCGEVVTAIKQNIVILRQP